MKFLVRFEVVVGVAHGSSWYKQGMIVILARIVPGSGWDCS